MINIWIKILIVFLVIIMALFIAGVALGFWRTSQIQQDARETVFLSGTLPSPAPDGFYKGSATRYKTSWLGKKFNATDATGVNVFDNGSGGQTEKYPFVTSVSKGLSDNINVLKIDYNVPQNPFWVRLVEDEMVEVKNNQVGAPTRYLGKMYVRIIPGFPFSILYFDLKK